MIGWFWTKAGRFKTRPPAVCDLDVHLLHDVCWWACFHFLSGQLQFSSQVDHPIKCFLTFFYVTNVWLCYILQAPDSISPWIIKQVIYMGRWKVALSTGVNIFETQEYFDRVLIVQTFVKISFLLAFFNFNLLILINQILQNKTYREIVWNLFFSVIYNT